MPNNHKHRHVHACSRQYGSELHHRAFPLPGDQPRYAPTRRIDVQHYRLELKVDFERHAVDGVATLSVRSLAEALTAVELDAASLAISAAIVDEEPVSWTLEGERMILHLSRPATWDEELTVEIHYSAQPERGLYFVEPDAAYPDKHRHAWTQSQDVDAHAWFPCYTLPGDKATSEIRVTVPGDMFALSNGRLMGVVDEPDGAKTFHWRQDVPHSAYLITLAVGPFVEIPYQANDVSAPVYVLPGGEEAAHRAFPQTPDMIAFFADKIGVPYPYAQYAQVCVQDFIMGGMENTGATTLTDMILPDERIMPDWDGTSLVAHELAHQWFGDLLTCRDWSHGWLNEGFATYFDALYHEHAQGTDEFRYIMHENAQAYLDEDTNRYRRPIVERTYTRPLDIFDRHLYPKGAWVLHMIRAQLGDAAWWRAINHYVTRHREQTVITSDLERAIEQATGINLEKFFDQWLYHGGHPEFKIEYTWDDARKLASLRVRQTQQIDDLTPIFDLPVDVVFEYGSQEHRVRVRVDAADQTFYFGCPEQPRRVRFDPEGAILKTLDFPRAHVLLVFQLEHVPDVTGRIEAANELGKQAERRGVEALNAALLREPFWGVAAEIARALGQARTPLACEGLLAALDHPHSRVRRAVVEHLAPFKADAGVAEAIATRLRSGDPSARVEAELAKTLGALRNDGAFEALTGALARPSWNDIIRRGALDGLAAAEDARAFPVALEWSRYGKPHWPRIAAVYAVAALGKASEHRHAAVQHLAELLDDLALHVRRAAASALATLGDRAALSALDRAAARDQHPIAVRAAREAARAIREGSAQSDELKGLRADVDKLTIANRELKDRLEFLENNP